MLSDCLSLLILSEIMFFRLISLQKPPFPFHLSLYLCVCLCFLLLYPSMPRLRETYLQIQERNKREIRHRTNVRIAQLQLQQDNRQSSAQDEQTQETETILPSTTVFETHCTSISALSTFRSFYLLINKPLVSPILSLLLWSSTTSPFFSL